MTSQAAQQNRPPPATPLDRLGSLLHADMLAVNETILNNMRADVPLIPQLAGYLIAAGGKRIRPLLTVACARLYGCEGPRPYGLAAAVEFIHSATLLHDDVVDESATRRGQKAAPVVFGNQASVLVGDFLFSRAFQLMVADGSLPVLKILSDAAATIAQGEVMQLSTAGNLETTMADYLTVIGGKTAALFAAACETGPAAAGCGDKERAAMRAYGDNLGIAFQIADDVLDYAADQKTLGKKTGDDFRGGKMTAPVLIALSAATEDERAFWQRTIGRRDQREGDFETALAILARHDAAARGTTLARQYADRAREALAEAPDCELRDILNDLAEFTVTRDH